MRCVRPPPSCCAWPSAAPIRNMSLRCLPLGALRPVPETAIGGGKPMSALSAAKPTSPGVYVEELPSSTRTISTLTTSVTAFVGHTRRGPLNEPVRVTGFADFERRFGGLSAQSPLAYAVHQFFGNGGSPPPGVPVPQTGG